MRGLLFPALAFPLVASAPAAAQRAEHELRPPRIVDASAPELPEESDTDVEPTILVHVVVEPDGTISSAHVETPHDVVLDQAATEAVQAWRFEPATDNGRPIRAAVRVSVHFQARIPHFDLADEHTGFAPGDESLNHEHLEVDGSDIVVFSDRAEADGGQTTSRSTATHELDRAALELAPHRDTNDLLNTAPGVFAARVQGDAIASRIALRGFDAEHGQDLALSVGGVPVNEPSHLHAQGYANLAFVPAEVVGRLRLREGVSDVRQGDFATAGSIELDLSVARRGLHLEAEYGSFHTARALGVWAPRGEDERTFGAVFFRRSDGYGVGRDSLGGGAIGQAAWGSDALRFRVLGALFATRAGTGAVLPRQDALEGRVAWDGVLPVAAAQGQTAMALRGLIAGFVTSSDPDGSEGELGIWAGMTGFRYLANYTGYLEIARSNPDWRGRGDRIEQIDEALSAGLRAHYRAPRFEAFGWLRGFVEAGLDARVDLREQDQNLLTATSNQTWDARVDARIQAVDVGGYVEGDVHLGEHVRLRGGVRGNVLVDSIDDRLGNLLPRFRRESYIVGYRRTATGLAFGPRLALEWSPIESLTLSASYGEGYRSPQARLLQEGEPAPYTKVWSGDAGARVRLGRALDATLSGFATVLSRDIAFDPGEGRLEPLGPSSRLGVAVTARVQPWEFIEGMLSMTYVRATLDAPPLPTIEEPNPPFVSGQLLPYVAPFTLRADVAAHHTLVTLGDQPLEGRLGLGVSVLSARPLPYGEFAAPVGLLDIMGSLRWGPLELGVEVFNLTDSRWAAAEFAFASDWQDPTYLNQPGGATSRVPARHFSAGAPLTAMVQLGVQL